MFRSKLIKSYELVEVYNNKYTIRYVLGSDFKTLEQKDLQTFKDRFMEHIKNNGFVIEIQLEELCYLSNGGFM